MTDPTTPAVPEAEKALVDALARGAPTEERSVLQARTDAVDQLTRELGELVRTTAATPPQVLMQQELRLRQIAEALDLNVNALKAAVTSEERADRERRIQADKERQEDRGVFRDIANQRRTWGYGLIVVAGLGILALAILSACELRDLAAKDPLFPRERFWLLVVDQVVLTVAFVLFLYQVLRAGERLSLPHWWVESKPEIAKMMLGIKDPITTSKEAAQQAADVIAKVTEPVANAVAKIADAVTPKK